MGAEQNLRKEVKFRKTQSKKGELHTNRSGHPRLDLNQELIKALKKGNSDVIGCNVHGPVIFRPPGID